MICSFILFGKRDSCAQGDLTTYNAMPPKKIMFFGKQVHGAPLPFGTSGSLGKKLSHDLAGWYSLPQRMGVLPVGGRSEEHTSELQSLMRSSYAVFCLKKKITCITYDIICLHTQQPTQ